jgi:hypothetical protein
MPSPREPGPGAAPPTESAKDSGHYHIEPVIAHLANERSEFDVPLRLSPVDREGNASQLAPAPTQPRVCFSGGCGAMGK